MDLLNLPLSGWPSSVLTLLMLIIGGWYITKNAKSKAKIVAEESQKSAIEAMQAEISALRRQMEDERRKNIRLEHTLDTLVSALQKKGIFITISGDMIDIQVEDAKKSTIVRIQDSGSLSLKEDV